MSISKSKSWEMFDNISPTYDLTNHILSLGQDIFWRKALKAYLKGVPCGEDVILDVATGTGDVLISLLKGNSKIKSAVGIDMSRKMLEIGNNKIKKCNLDKKINLVCGDANSMPFEEGSFNIVTIAFGIRNMNEPIKVLREMFRVLKNGGRALILEFSLPRLLILKELQLFYLRNMVPLVGGILSGSFRSYRYLNRTVEDFPYGEDFCRIMTEAGFSNVRSHPATFGIATIYSGDKAK